MSASGCSCNCETCQAVRPLLIKAYKAGQESIKAEADQKESSWINVKISKLLSIRDALILRDIDDAYHQLYALVDSRFTSTTPWAEWERRAAQSELAEKEG